MKAFHIGIIGYGGFGKFLHTHWNRLERVRVAAIADEMAEKTQGLEQVRVFSDYRKMLKEPDIDVVAIVTPPDTHDAIACACMEAGKHVLIEKPLATTLADARKIIETRDRTGRVAGIDFIMRFNPLLNELHKLYRQGVFGQLRRVDVENYAQDETMHPDHWFWDRKRSGGILVEHGVHFIDLVHFLHPAGVIALQGMKHDRNSVQEDQIMANIVYDGGLIATHYHAFSRPGFFEATRIKLAFDLADLELHGWIPLYADVKCLVNAETKRAMLAGPLFKMDESIPVDKVSDDSRPKGWGTGKRAATTGRRVIRSGGAEYEVEEQMTGTLHTRRSKLDVYAECVQLSLLDVLKKIENPAHELAAPLETGLESLEIAIRASEMARDNA